MDKTHADVGQKHYVYVHVVAYVCTPRFVPGQVPNRPLFPGAVAVSLCICMCVCVCAHAYLVYLMSAYSKTIPH